MLIELLHTNWQQLMAKDVDDGENNQSKPSTLKTSPIDRSEISMSHNLIVQSDKNSTTFTLLLSHYHQQHDCFADPTLLHFIDRQHLKSFNKVIKSISSPWLWFD
jgi:hypothetical protein